MSSGAALGPASPSESCSLLPNFFHLTAAWCAGSGVCVCECVEECVEPLPFPSLDPCAAYPPTPAPSGTVKFKLFSLSWGLRASHSDPPVTGRTGGTGLSVSFPNPGSPSWCLAANLLAAAPRAPGSAQAPTLAVVSLDFPDQTREETEVGVLSCSCCTPTHTSPNPCPVPSCSQPPPEHL